MYRIRIHGRGGQGIKTAGRVLGAAFFREGFTVQDSSRYGAERRGAPIVAYVRAARAAIDERGAIESPDLVVVVDETLLQAIAGEVLAGAVPRTVLLVSSRESAEAWRHRLAFAGTIVTLAPRLEGSIARVDAMGPVGAAARLVGRISRAALEHAVREETAELGDVDASVAAALEAYELMGPHEGVVVEPANLPAERWTSPGWVELAVEGVEVAAPVIHAQATSRLAKTGLWRTMRPVLDEARCHRCWWICSTLCPDNAIPVDAGGKPSIDYDHCKGCLVCVAVCPHHAIEAVAEAR